MLHNKLLFLKTTAMHFTKLLPNIFYKNINDSVYLFVNCL